MVQRAVAVVRHVDVAAFGCGDTMITHCKHALIVAIVFFIGKQFPICCIVNVVGWASSWLSLGQIGGFVRL